MRVSREQATRNRERIVATAATLFREHGFDGIGVADIMGSAGLTHGGFYGHFASKEQLAAEASAKALTASLARWQRRIDADGRAGFSVIADAYLSTRHRDHPGSGCALAALGAEARRHDPAVQQAFGATLSALVDAVTSAMPGRDSQRQRARAIASLATMVGALVLARAAGDDPLSGEILETARASLPG